jgi:hypothetical protein
VANQAAAALDCFASFYVRHGKRAGGEGGGGGQPAAGGGASGAGGPAPAATAAAVRAHLAGAPGFFSGLMSMLFHILVFGEAANQWALARPLLPLTLAAEMERPDAWEAFSAELVGAQPSELRGRMREELGRLMKDVTRGLDVNNRDRFAQKLTVFRLAFREFAA